MARHKRQPAAWLLGLVIAVVVFAVALMLFNLLGFGDDPVVEGLGLLGR